MSGRRNIMSRKSVTDGRILVLALVLALVLLLGLCVAVAIFWATRGDPAVKELEFCFSNKCVDLFKKTFENAISVISLTFSVLVAIATVGGIFVALLVYRETVRANSLSNHISHLALFRSYVEKEVGRMNMLRESSVDSHCWYVLMFPQSRVGDTTISFEYNRAFEEIRKCILSSNSSATRAENGSFRFLAHQDQVIAALKGVGLTIRRQPRMEFFELEGEIYQLIDSVNSAFCYSEPIERLPDRRYR
ncbi:retron Ec48 family effector membrane protein [Stenotrophomonas terrae]|uniref:retron Ec48 family effector membrane protein n=1 Tax=Stenotrophomonas terrae TaxID=405446 RepID=UPI003D3666E2